MNLDDLLGIRRQDPVQMLALDLVGADDALVSDLVALRESTGLSQQDVADRMGISQSAVSHIESGHRDLRMSTLRRYAHAVRADVTHTVETWAPARRAAVSQLRADVFSWDKADSSDVAKRALAKQRR